MTSLRIWLHYRIALLWDRVAHAAATRANAHRAKRNTAILSELNQPTEYPRRTQ